MKNNKLKFNQFEALSEDAEGKLVSGFSEAFEGDHLIGGDDGTNLYCPNNNCSCPGSGSGSGK